jgi:PD-(D/E)XK nuclease superfamily
MVTEGGLYVQDGRAINTHSMLKTFRRCPKQTQYKYFERLQPRTSSKPLTEGTWMHKLLEVDAKGGEWRDAHRQLSYQFSDLFDEEKQELGNLPVTMARMMRSYKWHYAHDPWKILEVEFIVETEFPDGSIYRGRIDKLVEDQYGLWIVDHKFNARMPDLSFRILDAASALYIWAARRMGIPVQGHIWDYVRRKAPTVPQLLKDGSRLSRKKIETDYPTLVRAIKRHDLDPADYSDQLAYLKKLQFRHGEPQFSPFFKRQVLEKDPEMLKQVAREAFHTAKRMNSYNFSRVEYVERVPDRSCAWMCAYSSICGLELFGGDPRTIRSQKFRQVDPMYYYNDDPPDHRRDNG